MNALRRNQPDQNRGAVQIGKVVVPVLYTAWGVVATITPKLAGSLLEQNERNRNVRPSRWHRYARDMVRGWALNGETIIFSVNGNLLNGQHRLLACIEAGVPFETYIIGDIPEEHRRDMDQVLSRTTADVMGADEPDARNLAAALVVAWKLENNGHLFAGAGIPYPTREDQYEYLEANPGIRDSLGLKKRLLEGGIRYRPALGAALHYLMYRRLPDGATEFWSRLADGVGLYPGHPVLALRNLIMKDIGAPRRMEDIDLAAVTIKAWNAYVQRNPVKFLRWRRRGTNPESFPILQPTEEARITTPPLDAA